VPADDECFNNINQAQWMWYYYNFLEDRNNQFTDHRDLVEYQVSFFEPKVVQDIIKERQAKDTQKFSESIKNTFGRDIEFGGNIQSSMKDLGDVSKIIATSDKITKSQRRSKDDTIFNFGHWLEINLG
jgi:hypothetical protein